MLSRRRRAQIGLLSACFAMVTMLAVLYWGSWEAVSPEHRYGMSPANDGGKNLVQNLKVVTMGK
jgi:TRAP-type mannitol/chloroaromatic compound transport system permease small subunit